ncbi:MAG: M61 family metallopeptidase [Granulosicoccus sp.]
MSSVEYSLGISAADAHLIDVQLTLSSPDPEGQVLSLPNWIPGSYMIRDFSRNIVSINARCNGDSVALEKVDKSTWKSPTGLAQLTVNYRVYAWDLSVRAAHVDRTHAFFNGTSVFLSAQGLESEPHHVFIQRPLHDTGNTFEVATTLPGKELEPSGFGHYVAADYDELIDHPVEMGTFKRLQFDVFGVPHEVVLTGNCYFDEQRVVDDLVRICEYEIAFFGKPAPYDRYVFMVMVADAGYGGLEHRSSTALMITRENLPVPGEKDISDKYLEFLGLCSHEYFHNWNVKRIKPARFVPFQLQSESYTELLWFFEGMTSYYDDLILVRAGLISKERYLGVLSKTLTRVQRGPGRLSQSVTDSSFDAWTKFYKQDENAPNAIVSYYAKGALVALCLDSLLRRHSNHAVTLDSLMLKLWDQWCSGKNGIAEQEPQALVAQLIDEDLSGFFNAALYETDELPVISALENLGVDLQWMPRRSSDDVGGTRKPQAPEEESAETPYYWLGANVVDAAGGVRITHVMNASPAERAGLSAGDVMIAMAGYSVSKADVSKHLQRLADQRCISIHYFRLGQLQESRLSIEPAPLDTAVLTVTDEQLVDRWIGSDTAAS